MTQTKEKSNNTTSSLDFKIRKYKQKLARSGVPSEAKKHDAYDKPGVRRRKAREDNLEEIETN